MCAVAMIFEWFTSTECPGVTAVSDSNPSIATPAMLPELIDTMDAASLMSPPRAVLMTNAVFFILANNNAHFTFGPVFNPPQTASELITSYQNFPL